MVDNFAYPCTVLDVLVGVRAGTLMDMFIELEVVVINVRSNVVFDAWIDTITDILVVVSVSDVDIIAVAAAVIALEFVVPKSCAVDILAGMLVGLVGDVLADVLAGVTICVVPGIGVAVLTEANANILATITTLEIAVPAPLEKSLCFW